VMKVTRKFVSIFLLFLITNSGFAGNADIEINVGYDSILNLSFGDIGQFSVTIRNNGPDVAGSDSIIQKPVRASAFLTPDKNGEFSLAFGQDTSVAQPCDFLVSFGEPRPPNPLVFAYEFYFPPIEPGESLTCYGFYLISFNSGTRAAEWLAVSIADIDPDEFNNAQTMVFGIQPVAVPTLSFYTLFALSILLFSVGYISIRKKHLYTD